MSMNHVNKRVRIAVESLLDLAAQEADDGDESENDEEEDGEDDFIDDNLNDSLMDSGEEETRYSNVGSTPDTRREAADQHRDAEALAERFRQLAAQLPLSQKSDISLEDIKWTMEKPERQYAAFANTNRDARLYSIRVKPGKEIDVVLYILQEALVVQNCRVYSAICRPCVRGFVYVEAASPSDAVLICCKSIFYRGGVTVVSLEDAVALLGNQLPSLRAGQRWVRVKRGIYAGDLAYLLSPMEGTVLQTSKAKVPAWIIPRISEGIYEDGPPQQLLKRKHSNIAEDIRRPPAKIFDPEAVKQRRSLRKINDSEWVLRNQVFINGFLEMKIPNLSLNFADTTPTRSELQTWAALDNGNMDHSLRDCIKQSLLDLCAEFWVGDRVKVISPEHQGEDGKVQRVTDEGVLVQLKSTEELLARPTDLRRVFEAGDFVQIISGAHEGSSGWIVHMEPSAVAQAFLSELGTDRELACSIDQLHMSTPPFEIRAPPVRSQDDLDLLGRLTNRNNVLHSLPIIITRGNITKGLRGSIRSVKEDFLPYNLEPFQDQDQAVLSHVCRRDCLSCSQYRYRDRDRNFDAGHQCVSTCAACLDAILQKAREQERMQTLRKFHDLFSGIKLYVYIPARQKTEVVDIINVRPDDSILPYSQWVYACSGLDIYKNQDSIYWPSTSSAEKLRWEKAVLELIHCQQLLDIRSVFPADAAVVNISAPLWPSVVPKTPPWNNDGRDIDSLEDPWRVGSRLVDEELDWPSVPNNDVYSVEEDWLDETLRDLPLHVIMAHGSRAYGPRYANVEGKLLRAAPDNMVTVRLLWSENPVQLTVPIHHVLPRHPTSTPKPRSVSHVVVITGPLKGQFRTVVKVDEGDKVVVKGKKGQQEEVYSKYHLTLSNQPKK